VSATIHPGPWLLRPGGTTLAEHRARYGPLVRTSADELVRATEAAEILGRGGAGFPFARKLETARSRPALRRHLVVNLSEGEPASAKDAALARVVPHLVLDGAVLTAAALRTREVHLVLPGEDAATVRSVQQALAERCSNAEDRGIRWKVHRATHRFVAGESSAVLQLILGNDNLPVTAWEPAARRGLHGRPTLVCNAETLAQVAALVREPESVPGLPSEPGTRILSVTRSDGIHVIEVAHGAAWSDVLTDAELGSPILLGGYHGSWVAGDGLRDRQVTAYGPVPLGAGIVIPLPTGTCPLERTTELLEYLAGQSARRCGPCVHGLPALADAHGSLSRGADVAAVHELARLVTGRGACAHPDGTAQLARSSVSVFADDVAAHAAGHCLFSGTRLDLDAAAR